MRVIDILKETEPTPTRAINQQNINVKADIAQTDKDVLPQQTSNVASLQSTNILKYKKIVTNINKFLNSDKNIQLDPNYSYYREHVTPEDYNFLTSFIETKPIVSDAKARRKIDIFNRFLKDRDAINQPPKVKRQPKDILLNNPMPPDLDLTNPLHEQWKRIAKDVVLRRDCTITTLEMWDIIKKQQWRCALSNREFNETNNRLSFDRIDSDKRYEVGNLWFTTHAVNVMKNQLTVPQVVSLCKFIHDKNTVNKTNGSI
jgi:hypothetical protein